MQIPEHLLHYDEQQWMPQVEHGIHLPTLRAREKWRQAQDAWGTENGIDRTQFEALRKEQR